MKISLSQPTVISEGTLLYSIVDRNAVVKRASLRQQLKDVQPSDTVVIQYEGGQCDQRSVRTLVSRIKSLGAQPVMLSQTGNGGEQLRSVTHGMDVPMIHVGCLCRNIEAEIRDFRF